ncbi:hypothetical protein HDU98_003633 [Podochytrium sp. JEL0797]|nr:hypothetical protein HDU98_003633 [Podochytrium sp. JEL0797]
MAPPPPPPPPPHTPSTPRAHSQSSRATADSPHDLSGFVSYLLDGSGAENVVDLQRLRRELEDESNKSLSHDHHDMTQISRPVSPQPSVKATRQNNSSSDLSISDSRLDASKITHSSTPNKNTTVTRNSLPSSFDRNYSKPTAAVDPSLTMPSDFLNSFLSAKSPADSKNEKQTEVPQQNSTKTHESYASYPQTTATITSKPPIPTAVPTVFTQRQPSLKDFDAYMAHLAHQRTSTTSSHVPASYTSSVLGGGRRSIPEQRLSLGPMDQQLPNNDNLTNAANEPSNIAEDEVDESLMKIYGGFVGSNNASKFTNSSSVGVGGRVSLGTTDPRNSASQQPHTNLRESESHVRDLISGYAESNPTTPTTHPSTIHHLSTRLTSLGLPALPSSPTHQDLTHTLTTLLNELSSRTRDAQTLQTRVREETHAREQLETRIHELERTDREAVSKDWKIIQEQQDALASTSSQIAILRSDLVTARHDLQDAQTIHSHLKQRLAEQELAKLSALSDLESIKQKAEKTRKQNEQTFSRIAETVNRYRTDVSKSGVDRLTLEVIEVYESKLAELRSEVDELRSLHYNTTHNQKTSVGGMAGDPNPPTSRIVTDLDQEIASLESQTHRRQFTRQGPNGESYTVTLDRTNLIHAQKVLEEQIENLEHRLDQAHQKLTESTQQSELLRLQLLESKRPGWVQQARTDLNASLTTRELIRRDKTSYTLKLYQIDAMNLSECRSLLKQICIHLSITDVPSLLPGLEAIDKTLRLLPQLQRFITQMQDLVTTHYTHLFDPTTPTPTTDDFQTRVKKLPQILETVTMWATESSSLRQFRTTLCRATGIREGEGCVAGVMEVLKRWKQRAPVTDGDNVSEEVLQFVEKMHAVVGVRQGVGSLDRVVGVCESLLADARNPREGSAKDKQAVEFVAKLYRVMGGVRSHQECLDRVQELMDRQEEREVGGNDNVVDAFVASIHKVVGVNQKAGSLEDCLETIRVLVEKGRNSPQAQKQTNMLYTHIVTHFMELFEIQSESDVLTAVNELYVMWAERNAGIARLRSSLRNSRSVNVSAGLDTPGRVLATAAELIDSVFDQTANTSLDFQHHDFDETDLLEAVNSATHNNTQRREVPLDWAEADQDSSQEYVNPRASHSGGGGGGGANRSWAEISSSIRNLTAGVGSGLV